jgi:N-acetyl sugar amidotransferase
VKYMRYCKRCMYPEIAVNLELDDVGVCSACMVSSEGEFPEEETTIRERRFVQVIEEMKKITPGDYDCIVPVGGGKDSYWQAHFVKEYGLNPLLVTYHGNNFYPEGQSNLDRMREALNCHHWIFYPGVETLVKLNRVCFKKMGDMNWHNHSGILIVPMVAAIKFQIPLVIWGEIAWDISGMYSPDDHVEYNKRMVLEHDMRGFTLHDMVGEEGLTEEELSFLRMPSDEEFAEHNIRGIYLGNFFRWDPPKQTQLMIDKYDWEPARQPFERTYRTMSNLDDMHENGIHDYMKWIKFGYGRATDHASKDVRLGYMTREQGIEMVRNYDHVKPRRDLERWLDYVDMPEEEFDRIADTFRDPRVWGKDAEGNWIKDNIWDFEEREGCRSGGSG